MKTRFLLTTMIAAFVLQGASFGSQSDQGLRPPSSRSREKSDGDPSGGQKDDAAVRNRNAGRLNDGQKPEHAAGPALQRHPSQSYSKKFSSQTPAVRGLRRLTSKNGTGSHATGSAAFAGLPSRATDHRRTPASLPAIALNGQGFKSSRDPGARLAINGGPAAVTRSTAAISGTNTRRKP